MFKIRFNDLKFFFNNNKIFILASILFTFLIALWVKPQYRVLSDEAALVSNSYSLYKKHTPEVITGTLNTENGLQVINKQIPARQSAFSFFTSLLHTLTGYRIENAYCFNLILSLFFSFFFLKLIENYFNWKVSLATLGLIYSLPIIPLYIRSAGFDFYNLSILTIFFYTLVLYEKNQSYVNYKLLVFLSVFLLYNRYEVVLPLIIVWGLFIKWNWVDTKAFVQRYKIFILLSFISLWPLLWQRALYFKKYPKFHSIYYGTYKIWKEGMPAFSLAYLYPNLKSFLHTIFLDFNHLYFMPWVFYTAVLAVIVYLIKNNKTKKNKTSKSAVLIFTYIMVLSIFLLTFISGEVHFYIQSRLFMPILVYILTCNALLFNFFSGMKKSNYFLILIPVLFLIFANTKINQYKNYNVSRMLLDYYFLVDQKQIVISPKTLLISPFPVNYTPLGISSLKTEWAVAKWDIIRELHNNKKIEDIYFLTTLNNDQYVNRKLEIPFAVKSMKRVFIADASKHNKVALFKLIPVE